MNFKLNYKKRIILQYPNTVIWKLNEWRIFHEYLNKPIYTKRHFRGKSIIFHPFILTFNPNSLFCGQGLLNSGWSKQPYFLKKQTRNNSTGHLSFHQSILLYHLLLLFLPSQFTACLAACLHLLFHQLNQRGLYLINILEWNYLIL